MRLRSILAAIATLLLILCANAQATYKVKGGDTDCSIGRHFGITEHALHLANPSIKWERLQIGATLRIPGKAAKESKPANKTTHVLSMPELTPPFEPKIDPNPALTYTVREGDNDWKIANRLAIRVQDLHRLNPGVKFEKMTPGTVLNVIASGRKLPDGIINTPDLEPPLEKVGKAPINTAWAMLDGDRVGVRSAPSKTAQRVTLVDKFTKAKVISKSGDWYCLKFQHGTKGWIRGDLLTPASEMPDWAREPVRRETRYAMRRQSWHESGYRYRRMAYHSRHSRPEEAVGDIPGGGRADVVAIAAKYRGVHYHYGGSSPNGFDCSGLTSYVYRKEGISLPHNAAAQSRTGKAVSKDGIKPGDLVFFKSYHGGHRVGHAGIAIGNGKFIHASSGSGRVRVDTYMRGHYASRFAGARTYRSTAKKSTEKKKDKDSK